MNFFNEFINGDVSDFGSDSGSDEDFYPDHSFLAPSSDEEDEEISERERVYLSSTDDNFSKKDFAGVIPDYSSRAQSPIDYFLTFLNLSTMQLISERTNKYHFDKTGNFLYTTPSEIMRYIGNI